MNKKSKQNIRVANFIEEARLGGPQMRMALIASSFNKISFNKKIDLTLIFPKDESKDFQNKFNQVEWDLIIGMRHKIIHDYFENFCENKNLSSPGSGMYSTLKKLFFLFFLINLYKNKSNTKKFFK